MSIAENIRKIKEELPTECKLIAVTKTHPVAVLKEAYDAGHKVFGENKVQDMTDKYFEMPKDIEWHMIGHLQTNKVKYIVSYVSLIHSVDSIKLLSEINWQAFKAGKVINCLLQVFIATEETKFGFDREDLMNLLMGAELESFGNVKICGLMGMASNTDDKGQVREEFRALKSLFEELKKVKRNNFDLTEISMGMSGDYKIAAEEGSTIVRVGSAIFGNRNYNI